jgi:hypothetical protein
VTAVPTFFIRSSVVSGQWSVDGTCQAEPSLSAKNLTNEATGFLPAIVVSPYSEGDFGGSAVVEAETNEATDAPLPVVSCPLLGDTCAPTKHARVEATAASENVRNEAICSIVRQP